LNLVVFGPPGSGKGTQAKLLQEKRGWPQLSTGDMLRAAIAAGTELGKTSKALMDAGELVPDDVVVGIIGERYDQPDCEEGAIFDGFPRTIPQARALDSMLKLRNRKIDLVIELKVDDAALIDRVRQRIKESGGVARAGDAAEPPHGLLSEHGPAARILQAEGQAGDRRRHGAYRFRDQGDRTSD
jgi:adenylate kinase